MPEYVDVSRLKLGSFNPKSRTEKAALKTLRESIESRGFLEEFPIIVGNDGKTIGDGHRRYTVAKELGHTKVPVQFSKLPAQEIFALQMQGKKNMNTLQMLQSVDSGVSVEDFPASFKTKYNQAIRLCGDDVIKILLDHDTSPDIINRLKKVLDYITRCAPERDTDQKFAVKVLRWAIHNNMGYRMRQFVDMGGPVATLLWAIDSNKPLPR